MSDVAAAAERALEAALAESGARDPREFYRERLRELKRVRPAEYSSAVAYYTDTLLPDVAANRRDALTAWTEYGRRLAEALAPGRTVGIDESGRARPFGAAGEASVHGPLVLHLPHDSGARALVVALPRTLSAAQRATYDVLVSGKQRFSGETEPA
jgi:hypothetical protein